MPLPKRVLVRSAGLALAGALAWGLWTLWDDSDAQTRLLPNGTQLTLKSVAYGRKSRMPTAGRWRDRLGPFIPESWARKLGCRQVSVGGTNQLVFWLVGDLLATTRLRAVTLDEHGCELGLTHVSPLPYLRPGQTLLPCEFSVFPRRAERVGLRLYEQQTNNTWSILAEFSTPNPDRRPWPVWEPVPRPITKSAGGADFTLLEINSGVQASTSPPQPASAGERPGLYLKFRLAENGRPTSAWTLEGLRISDGSGQVISPGGWGAGTSLRENYVVITGGGLCDEETAWKLDAKFAREADFSKNELWTVRGVPVPDDRSASVANAATNLHGVQLRLHGIVGLNCSTPKARRMLPEKPLVHLTVLTLAENQRLKLTHAVDDRGREVRRGGSASEQPDYFFALSLPEEAKSVDLTFAVTHTVGVEYLVKPARVKPADVGKLER